MSNSHVVSRNRTREVTIELTSVGPQTESEGQIQTYEKGAKFNCKQCAFAATPSCRRLGWMPDE